MVFAPVPASSGEKMPPETPGPLYVPPAGLAPSIDACRRGDDPACIRIGYLLERLFSGDDALVKDRSEAHLIAAAPTSNP